MESKIELFKFDNYKDFLKEFFRKEKEKTGKFSQRKFAKLAGFSDHSQLTHIVVGRRNLTDEAMQKLIAAFSFEGHEKDYFETLVHFNQAKTVAEKENLYEKLNNIRQRSDAYKVNLSQFKYFEEWYYSVVLEIAVLPSWQRSYKKMAKMVYPNITAKEAREAVKFLEKIGMLIEDDDGKYHKPKNIIVPGDIPVYSAKKYRHDTIKLGIEASKNLPPEERYFLNYGFTITNENYTKYQELLNNFEKDLEKLVRNENKTPDRMYQCNIQFFPISNQLNKE